MARGDKKTAASTAKHAFPDVRRKTGLIPQQLVGEAIFQVEGVLTAQEVAQFVSSAEALGFQPQGSRGPKFGEAYRDNGRVAVDSHVLADSLWKAGGLSELFADIKVDGRSAVGLNPAIRFYRYEKGQQFGKHVDDSVPVARWPGGVTGYTVLLYLSGGQPVGGKPPSTGTLCGGQTVFYGARGKQVASVEPVAGRALLHRHGDDCLEHEALEVTSGVKYILRTDVVFAP